MSENEIKLEFGDIVITLNKFMETIEICERYKTIILSFEDLDEIIKKYNEEIEK